MDIEEPDFHENISFVSYKSHEFNLMGAKKQKSRTIIEQEGDNPEIGDKKFIVTGPFQESQEQQITRIRSIHKVRAFCLAEKDSLVVSAVEEFKKRASLIHYNRNSEIEKYVLLDDTRGVDQMVMPTSYDVFGIVEQKNEIIHWNLRSGVVKFHPFDFSCPLFASRLYYFDDSGLLCILQQSDEQNQSPFSLTYIQIIPRRKEYQTNIAFRQVIEDLVLTDQIINEYIDSNRKWSVRHSIIFKGNEDSMICWAEQNYFNKISFYSFGLHEQNWELLQHVIHFPKYNSIIDKQDKLFKIELCDVWRMIGSADQERFSWFIVTHTNKTEKTPGGLSENTHETEKVINNNYITEECNERKMYEGESDCMTIEYRTKESPILMTEREHDLHSTYISTATFGMILPFDHQENKAEKKRPRFICLEDKELLQLDKDFKIADVKENKFYAPAYNNNSVLIGVYKNGNVGQMLIHEFSVMDRKRITTFLVENYFNKHRPEQLAWVTEDIPSFVIDMIDYSK